jgi:hypothetical protein
VLVSVVGLERLGRWKPRGVAAGQEAARWIVFLCGAHFLFWYGLHVFENHDFAAAAIRYETWDAINHDDPEGRLAVNRELTETAGKHLVFVRYWPQHRFQEWVHNAADIDRSNVVWARDLGAAENEKLRRYYPDRTAWLLEPDDRPPKLVAYRPEQAGEIQELPMKPR